METQTSTTGITFKVDADVLAESAEATAEAVVKAKHDLDKAKETWKEAEETFLALGIESLTTSDGNTVDVIRGESTSVDVEILRGLVTPDLFDRVTSMSVSVSSLKQEIKDERLTDEEIAPAILRTTKKPYIKVK